MKTALLKTAFAAIVVMFALFLGTCAPQLPEGEEADVEYTDVEYEIAAGTAGNIRVKSIKLYLDGVKVPLTRQQRAIQRALSLETAAASHDYFEVVLAAAVDSVARANWEIGYSAGIQGVARGGATGINYGSVFTGTTVVSGPCSTVFVGRKTNKTLLGVGFLTHVNDIVGNTINESTTSITYYVAPVKTWLGYYNSNTEASPIWSLRGKGTAATDYYGTGTDNTIGGATFMTATGPVSATPAAGPWATISRTNTTGTRGSFNPTGSDIVYYPVFYLPNSSVTAAGTTAILSAQYRIGGLDTIPTSLGDIVPGVTAPASVLNAIRVYGRTTTPTNTAPRGGPQVIKRRPTLLIKGRTYQAGTMYDSSSQVALNAAYLTAQNTHTINATTGDTTVSAAFNPTIALDITVLNQSDGIFAFTFQVPVFAITTRVADNDGTKFTKWFIRPADGPELYLLDNGIADGGMVMLGSQSSASDDWIEVITTGIGFSNN